MIVFIQIARTISLTFLSFYVLGVFASCDSTQTATGDSPPKERILRYDVNAPFTSLNPANVRFSGSTHIFPLIYSYLFIPDIKGELSPDLAVNWTYEADEWRWTIHLRDNALFHDNNPVTAYDVKYSINQFFRHRDQNPYASIEKITVKSDIVLELYLNKEDPFILNKLWRIEIVPRPTDKISDDQPIPVGSGPFKFLHRHGHQMVTLKTNSRYYCKPPALDRVVFYYQPDREKAWTRLLSDQTDIIQEISPNNYRILKQHKDRFHIDTYPLHFFTILLYNTYDQLFTDPKVRKALAMGIDRNYIVDHILNGQGRIAAGPMGPDSQFHNPGVTPVPFDPMGAIKLLNQAGWYPDNAGRLRKDGKPFKFTLSIFKEGQIERKVARFIQLNLNNLGIEVNINLLKYQDIKASYFQNTNFQAVLTELSGIHKELDILYRFWSPGEHGPSYAGCFNNDAVNYLIAKSLSTKNLNQRKALLQELDGLIASLQPGTFLFHKSATDVMSRRLSLPFPFQLTNEGIFRLQYASINKNYPLN